MTREEAKETIRRELSCLDYLKPGRKSGLSCPFSDCRSGQKNNGTGAVKYYPETNTCTCFSCGKSFDVLDIIQEEYSCDYNRALEIGAEVLRISIDTAPSASQSTQRRSNSMDKQINHKSDKTFLKSSEGLTEPIKDKPEADYSEYYKTCREKLQNSEEAVSYLSARGISLPTAERCGIGYDPAADPANFPGVSGEDTNVRYPRKRIILPTSSAHYVGRAINPNEQLEKANPKESHVDIFNKEELYRGNKTVFVAEGAFDAMSFLEIGAPAIGLNSENNTNLLLRAIKEEAPSVKNFVICFDNDKDPKTRENTAKAAESLRTALNGFGYNSLIFDVCGTEKDPNAALCANFKAFKERVAAAILEAEKPEPSILDDFFQEIQTERYKPFKTGLSWFDDLLGGGMLRQTTFYLLAPPAAGKTTLAQQVAEALAESKKPVIYYNFEMSREQMIAKDLSRRISKSKAYDFTMTAAEVLQGYSWNEKQRHAVTEELEKYRNDIFPYLQYNPTDSTDIETIQDHLSSIGSKAKAAGEEAPVIIIDYLHLIRSKAKLDVQELLKIATQAFNNYARNYDTIAFIISATNREANKGGVIGGSSGRDSSNIEYSAVYQASLSYYEVEYGVNGDSSQKIKIDSPEYNDLVKQSWRHMVLKLTKSKFGQAGITRRLYFHAAGNAFYSEYEWLPQDPERTPFSTESKTETKRI